MFQDDSYSKKIVLNKRVFLLIKLRNEILLRSKKENLIHIKKSFINSGNDQAYFNLATEVTSIQTNTFESFNKAKELHLHNALIREIETDAFDNLTKLVALRLSSNQIEKLPQFPKKLENLKLLMLDNNRLVSLEKDLFVNLVRLIELDISSNLVTQNLLKLFILFKMSTFFWINIHL